ncbi:MAG: cytidylate kinase family protein [Candidatus Aenigmarchaeota archaeon]|nr:cytidylate kinase family protein [Candidatus Aenigmarchaeota archaeon]
MKTYLKFLYSHEKKLGKKLRKRGLTITVSGLAGSGKTTGAKAIAKALKLKYYEIGAIQKSLARKRKISLEQQVKTRANKIDYMMDRKSLELAMRGGCVIVARLAGWVAGRWADAKILYVAPINVRAKRVARKEGISINEAKKRIRSRDIDDRKKYKKIYGIDLQDKSIYDIIIDNSKISLEEGKKIVVRSTKDFLKKKKIVIAISGSPGTGSTTIAKELAKKLRLKYFSPGKIFKSYVREKEAEAALKVWKTRGKSKRFHLGLDDQQRKIAEKGNCVICGKLSIFVLRDLADYKIWINAPLPIRARRVMKRDKLSFKNAKKLLMERELIERKEWKRIYGIDYTKQKNSADLSINTFNLNPKQVVEKILKFINSKKL